MTPASDRAKSLELTDKLSSQLLFLDLCAVFSAPAYCPMGKTAQQGLFLFVKARGG